MLSNITCSSSGAVRCYDNSLQTTAFGYYCKDSTCYQCPPGTFGRDGKICDPCPFGSWAPLFGQLSCQLSFAYSIPSMQKIYIPYGVTQLYVKHWETGVAEGELNLNTAYLSRQDNIPEFSSCNLSVPMTQEIYVIISDGKDLAKLSSTTNGEYWKEFCKNNVITALLIAENSCYRSHLNITLVAL